MGIESRILIIDDEIQIRRLVRQNLEQLGYRIDEAETGLSGINSIAAQRPDLVILDLGLTDIDGVEVIKRVREWSSVPILVLSVKDSAEDKIEALDAGADDYLIKPFYGGELAARLRAIFRRFSTNIQNHEYLQNNLKIDYIARQVFVANTEIHLTPIEYSLLRLLVQHVGRVITHNFILRELWGPNAADHSEYLRVHINHLRKKLGKELSTQLKTESGIGYRFVENIQ